MTEATETIQSLDSIIKGEADTQVEVGQETVTKEPEVSAPKVETKPAPTAGDKKEDESWTKAAVLDERRKRQALEAELAEARKTKTEPAKRPDALEDPEGALQHSEGVLANRILHERISLTREMMMDSKPDYEEMEAVFVDIAKQNPILIQQMNDSSNPAKFAYKTAKEHTEYQEFQKTKDTEEYRAFLEAKKAGKIETVVEDTPEQKRNKSAVKVPDLINATSAKSGHVDGEKSLKQILGR